MEMMCNETCQWCQQEALMTLYTNLNGGNWTRREGWMMTKTSANEEDQDSASHCNWEGVVCCAEDGSLLDLPYPGYIQYSLTNETRCFVYGGIAALLMSNNSMHGELDANTFKTSILGLTLEVLVMSGKFVSFADRNKDCLNFSAESYFVIEMHIL